MSTVPPRVTAIYTANSPFASRTHRSLLHTQLSKATFSRVCDISASTDLYCEKTSHPARIVSILLHTRRCTICEWPLAHQQAVRILNITPNGALENRMSPLEMVSGAKPNLQQIVPHIFGCPVSVLNFNKKRTDGKLAAFPSIYFGVDPIRPDSSQVLNESGNQ